MTLTRQQQIELLCDLEILDYAILKPENALSLVVLSLGSNPRHIGTDDKVRIAAKADAFKAGLGGKDDVEISTMLDNARAKEWRAQHLLLDDAAKLIAAKIWPDDHYKWEAVERGKCEEEYRKHLTSCVLMGGVPFINPHARKPFDAAKLSADRFPHDGLLRVSDLHLCLLLADSDKGYFPLPPRPVSKASPPVTPLYPSTLTNTRSCPPPADINTAVWGAKDLWSEGQFAILLCGAEPESRKARLSNTAIENAVRAIELAVAVESLTVAHLEQVPKSWDTFSAPDTLRYFRPADAIAWANRRRAEFPLFPLFEAAIGCTGGDVGALACVAAGAAATEREAGIADSDKPKPVKTRHMTIAKDLLEAFGCKKTLFENAHKCDWLMAPESHIKGKAGPNGHLPKYDPVALVFNLPTSTYGNRITENRAWQVLEKSFPDRYDEVSAADPRPGK